MWTDDIWKLWVQSSNSKHRTKLTGGTQERPLSGSGRNHADDDKKKGSTLLTC